MSDKELANAIVATGLARIEGDLYYMLKGAPHTHNIAEQFVRDWRVAGALMERVREQHISLVYLFECKVQIELMSKNESLPRAICEACVEALT